MGQLHPAQLGKTLNSSTTWAQLPRISSFSMRRYVFPSSTSRGHVSRNRRYTTVSRHRRRSKLRIARPNRTSVAPPIFTATIFWPLIPERIDRRGEISSTTVHRITQKKTSHAPSPFPPENFTLLRREHKRTNRN